MYSIRQKLNLTIITGMLVVLTIAAVFLYYLIAKQVQNIFDSSLLDKTHALISITELDEDGLEFDFTEGMMPEFEAGEDAQYYQVWEHGIDLKVKSASLGAEELPRFGSQLGSHQFADFRLASGRLLRVIEINFLPRVEFDTDEADPGPAAELESVDSKTSEKVLPRPQPLTLVFARERESLDGTLLAIGITISGVMLLVLVLSGLMVRRLVGNGLTPLSSLANQVGGIDESKLDLRLSHVGEQSTEIAPIEEQVNRLLCRLQSAFEREKRFSANVAHELRTPLSELRTLSEVGKMVPENRNEIVEFFEDVSEISEQMEKVVVILLELTRSDAGLLKVDSEDIELSNYCDQVWKHSINGERRKKTLVKNIAEDLVINTDRGKLGLILANLYSNAISYSPENADIKIDARIVNDSVLLEVRNAAVDLKPEDILHMTDRFWRKQRTGGELGHSGLGLSLVEALVKILNLKLNLQLDQQKIFHVTISGLNTG